MNIGFIIMMGIMLMAFQIPVLFEEGEDVQTSKRMPEGRKFR